MTSKHFASAAAAALTLWAASASAQQAAAPAAAPNPVQVAATAAEASAPVIAGICVYSQDQAIATSIVGKYVNQRLQQIDSQSNAELNDTATKIQADDRALTAQRATMAPDALQQAGQALQQRAAQFQQLAQVREREMQMTQQAALQTVAQSLDPLLVDVFTAHKCSVLLERNGVVLAAKPMDITADAVSRLDAKIQQFPFDRVVLPEEGQAAGGAPGAAPARAAAPARSGAAPTARAPAPAGAAAKPKR
jgi:Skp family chaperone for outer membrane proteins